MSDEIYEKTKTKILSLMELIGRGVVAGGSSGAGASAGAATAGACSSKILYVSIHIYVIQ